VDVNNLPKEALNDSAFVDILHQWAGDAKFGNIMSANAKAGGKKNQDNVAKALSSKITKDRSKIKDDKFAKLHAKLTGDLKASFTPNNGVPGNRPDVTAAANFLSNSKAVDLSEVEGRQFDDLVASLNVSEQDGFKNAIAQNVSLSQLKSILKSGNSELAKKLKDQIESVQASGGTTKAGADIAKDAELASL
jgi:hypothetical protein